MKFGVLWREVGDWRQHWRTRSFFQALVFGLVVTLLDTGTDISFAWSIPDVCYTNKVPIDAISSNPCGILDFMDVEYSSYTIIALPGILFALTAVENWLLRKLATRCSEGKFIKECFKVSALVISVLLLMCFWNGLQLAATRAQDWAQDPDIPQSFVDGYGYTIKTLAYFSATFIVGVKILGVFCHGPETRRLVLQAADAEAQFEAAHQLLLVTTIFLASGRWTTQSILSMTTSILVIARVGIHDLFNAEKEQLEKASLLGKIFMATSVLPVFVLTGLFRIGSLAVVLAWNEGGIEELVHLSLASLPALILVFLKIHLSLKDLTITAIGQGLMSERVSLHIWPCGQVGKKIGFAMASLHLVLYSSFLAWIINDPDPNWTSKIETDLYNISATEASTRLHIDSEADVKLYEQWVEETSARLETTGILCLVIGWITFPLIVSHFFYRKKFVANFVTTHLSKGEKNMEGEGDENKEEEYQGTKEEDGGKDGSEEKVMNEEEGMKEGLGVDREKELEEGGKGDEHKQK